MELNTFGHYTKKKNQMIESVQHFAAFARNYFVLMNPSICQGFFFLKSFWVDPSLSFVFHFASKFYISSGKLLGMNETSKTITMATATTSRQAVNKQVLSVANIGVVSCGLDNIHRWDVQKSGVFFMPTCLLQILFTCSFSEWRNEKIDFFNIMLLLNSSIQPHAWVCPG